MSCTFEEHLNIHFSWGVTLAGFIKKKIKKCKTYFNTGTYVMDSLLNFSLSLPVSCLFRAFTSLFELQFFIFFWCRDHFLAASRKWLLDMWCSQCLLLFVATIQRKWLLRLYCLSLEVLRNCQILRIWDTTCFPLNIYSYKTLLMSLRDNQTTAAACIGRLYILSFSPHGLVPPTFLTSLWICKVLQMNW